MKITTKHLDSANLYQIGTICHWDWCPPPTQQPEKHSKIIKNYLACNKCARPKKYWIICLCNSCKKLYINMVYPNIKLTSLSVKDEFYVNITR